MTSAANVGVTSYATPTDTQVVITRMVHAPRGIALGDVHPGRRTTSLRRGRGVGRFGKDGSGE